MAIADLTVIQRLSAALQGRSAAQLLSEIAQRGCHAIYRALQRHVLGRRFIAKRIYGYVLVLDSDDPGISSQLLRRGAREPEQKFIIESTVKPGMVAFDLGANIGYYTIMMARLVGDSGRVYAVEPFPGNFRLLGENIRRNRLKNVQIENVAIGPEDGEQQLMIAEKSNWHSLHVPRLNPDIPWHAKYARAITGSMPVKTRSLQTYLTDKEPIDLLRMDLEGYEVEILRSVASLPRAQTSRLRILFETHPEFYDPVRNDMRSVLEQLCSRHAFRIEYLDYHYGWRGAPDIESGQNVFARCGYGPAHIVKQFRKRAIYAGLRTADAIELICSSEYVNAALLAPDDQGAEDLRREGPARRHRQVRGFALDGQRTARL
jgi:FkbM family methyltransferase